MGLPGYLDTDWTCLCHFRSPPPHVPTAASWVSTSGTGMDKDSAMRGSFMKLFDYISGSNSNKKKIPMTGPVLTKIEPGQGPNCESTFTMNFYNPYTYQVHTQLGHAAAGNGLGIDCCSSCTLRQTASLCPDVLCPMLGWNTVGAQLHVH